VLLFASRVIIDRLDAEIARLDVLVVHPIFLQRGQHRSHGLGCLGAGIFGVSSGGLHPHLNLCLVGLHTPHAMPADRNARQLAGGRHRREIAGARQTRHAQRQGHNGDNHKANNNGNR
jgi:hypothetical protein